MNKRVLFVASVVLCACASNGSDPLGTSSAAVKPGTDGQPQQQPGNLKGLTWNDPSGNVISVIQSSVEVSPFDPTLYVADANGSVWLTTASSGIPQPVMNAQTWYDGADCTGTKYVMMGIVPTPRFVFSAPLGGPVVTLDAGPCTGPDSGGGQCCNLPDGGQYPFDGGGACVIGNLGYFTMPDVPPVTTVTIQSRDDGTMCSNVTTTVSTVALSSLVSVSIPSSLFAAPAHPQFN